MTVVTLPLTTVWQSDTFFVLLQSLGRDDRTVTDWDEYMSAAVTPLLILWFTSPLFFFFYLNSHHHLILSVFDTSPPCANVRRARRPLYLLCFLDFGRPCSIPAAQEAESLVNLIKILCETLVHSIMPYRHWQLPIQFMTSTSSSRVEWTALSTRTVGWEGAEGWRNEKLQRQSHVYMHAAHRYIFNSHT